MQRVLIGIGSNEGDRLGNVYRAVSDLSGTQGIVFKQIARIRETQPVGGPPQENYLNTAVEVESEFSAQELLERLKEIEFRMGRNPRGERWGPRPIDLDILFFGQERIATDALVVPHPRLHERLFVLDPLMDIVPEWMHPEQGKTVAELHAALCGAGDESS